MRTSLRSLVMPQPLRLPALFLAVALLLAVPGAQAQDLVINEFLADPGDYEGGEFVEIFNGTGGEVNLEGYTISDRSNTRYTFGNVTLGTGEYATILENSDDEVLRSFKDVAGSLSLNNTGDVITLADDGGNEVDSYDYADGEADEGVSQALSPNGNGNNNFALSHTFNRNGARFTPGQNNQTGNEPRAAAPGELIVREFMAAPEDVDTNDGEYIEIYNDGDTQTRLEEYVVRDEGSNEFTIDNPQDDPVIVQAGGFVVLCENPDPSTNGGVANCGYDYPQGFSLSNAGDEIIIDNPGGTEITRVIFDNEDVRGDGVAFELAAFADARDDNQTAQADYQGATLQLNDVDENGDDAFDKGSPGGLGAAVYASGDAGWRMLSAPVAGMTMQALADQNLIQGVPGSNYENAGQNFYVGYDGSSYGTPSGFDGTLAPEDGIYWQLYGQAKVKETDPLPDSLTSVVGPGPTGDVTADVSDTGQTFFLLGNPYDSNFDLDGLDLGAQNFSTTVQVWNPNAAESSSGDSGSYVPVAQGDPDDALSVWQGFFAERSSGSATKLTFSESAQVAGETDFIGGPNSIAAPQRRVLPLRLTGRDASGTVQSYDEAARLYFHPQARRPGVGPDVWDATKLTPFTSGAFATIALAPGGTGGPMKAQEGLPFALGEKIKVPLRFDRSGAAAGEAFTIAWPQGQWENIPAGWALTLTDRKTDRTVDLREASSYEFDLPSAGSEGGTAAVQARVPPVGQPLPLAEALAGGGPSAQATAPPRFLLTIDPNAALPVETDGFTAAVEGRDAIFSWRTLSEENNDRFVIERKTENGTWKEAAAVPTKAPGGTSTAPIRYRARVEGLSYGMHRFHLRQFDRDAETGTLLGKKQRVEIQMAEAYVLSGVYPNPFRRRATVEVAAREAQQVTVALFDARGRRVRSSSRGTCQPTRRKS